MLLLTAVVAVVEPVLQELMAIPQLVVMVV
jgi:hypothetical protein